MLPAPTMLLLYAFPLVVLAAQASLTYKGVDWSSLLVEEASGQTYKNAAGTVQPLETILKASGVNTVRQRLWVNPSDGDYGSEYNLKLAKRARTAGLDIYLDFHYSDSWVCIISSKQAITSADSLKGRSFEAGNAGCMGRLFHR